MDQEFLMSLLILWDQELWDYHLLRRLLLISEDNRGESFEILSRHFWLLASVKIADCKIMRTCFQNKRTVTKTYIYIFTTKSISAVSPISSLANIKTAHMSYLECEISWSKFQGTLFPEKVTFSCCLYAEGIIGSYKLSKWLNGSIKTIQKSWQHLKSSL